MNKLQILKFAVLAASFVTATSALAQTGTGGRGIDTAASTTVGGGANPGVALPGHRPKSGNPIAGVRDFFAAKNAPPSPEAK